MASAHDDIDSFEKCMDEFSKRNRKEVKSLGFRVLFLSAQLEKCLEGAKKDFEKENCLFDAEFEVKKFVKKYLEV